MEVVRSIRRFRGDGSLAGWIRKVAANKALMKLRRRAGSAFEETLPEELGDDGWCGVRHRGTRRWPRPRGSTWRPRWAGCPMRRGP